MEAMLEIRHFTKAYHGRKAVDDLSLTVEPGDIYGFIGHNGAGKTTTIRAVTGVLDFKEGDILVKGMSVRENPVGCKQITAYIPDNPDLYGYLTAIQYLRFIADVYGVEQARRQERIAEYAGRFEMTDHLGDLISTFSHGMKQKTALIAALLHDPQLLVLDEPFVGLDPKAAHILKQIMGELCGRGSAIFFSTHVLDVAEKLCNKIAVIKEGRLIASGTLEEVKGDQSLEDVFMELIDDE